MGELEDEYENLKEEGNHIENKILKDYCKVFNGLNDTDQDHNHISDYE